MPHTVPAEYTATKNAQLNKPINLYTIHDYDGAGNNLCFAEYKTDVTFNGVLYTAFPISIEALTENVQGQVDSVKVKISNVSRVVQYYIENYDFREKKVTLTQVWADQLADTDNVMSYIFYIDRYTSSEQVVEFECSSKFDVADVELPWGRYMRGVCRWLSVGGFKGTQCGYAGALTTCDGTLANCRIRTNQARFGAFPSVPTQRTFVS